MANGEIVFEAPWQSRVFGIAVALSEQGHFSWAEFQQQLIRVIRTWDDEQDEKRHDTWDERTRQSEYHYFDHFSAALSAILRSKGMLVEQELDALVAAYRERPHGHDHGDHTHHHNHTNNQPHDHPEKGR